MLSSVIARMAAMRGRCCAEGEAETTEHAPDGVGLEALP